MYRDVLGNSDYQRDLCGYGFLNGTSCLMGSDIYGGSVRLQLFFCLHVMVKTPQSSLRILHKDTLTARMVGSTGNPRCSPYLPGVTPPTILVPHSSDCFAF